MASLGRPGCASRTDLFQQRIQREQHQSQGYEVVVSSFGALPEFTRDVGRLKRYPAVRQPRFVYLYRQSCAPGFYDLNITGLHMVEIVMIQSVFVDLHLVTFRPVRAIVSRLSGRLEVILFSRNPEWERVAAVLATGGLDFSTNLILYRHLSRNCLIIFFIGL